MSFVIKKMPFLVVLIFLLFLNSQAKGGYVDNQSDKQIDEWDGHSWGKYISDKFNYKFEYPSRGWKINIFLDHIDHAKKLIRETVTLHNQDGAIITVDVWPNDNNQNIDQWFFEEEMFLISYFAKIGQRFVTKHDLVSVYYYEPRSPQTHSFHVTIFTGFSKKFRITYTEADEGKSEKIYLHIISSIEFLK